METPFSFIPSRQMNGAVRQARRERNVDGELASILSRAANATEAYPFRGLHLTRSAEVSNLKS